MDTMNPVEKLQAVVSHMPGWMLENDNEWMSYLRHPESGTGLQVSHHRGQTRFVISVDWPSNFNDAFMSGKRWGVIDQDGREPEITVAMHRPAKVLAADILRRMGHAAIPLSREALRKRQERVAQADKARALAEAIAQLFGGETPDPKPFQRYRFRLHRIVEPGYGAIEIYDYAPNAVMELTSIDAELTLKLVKVIAAHWQARVRQVSE